MSEVQALYPYGTQPDVRTSIARAAEASGVDFDFLLAQARLESSLDPTARAGTSSAAGLYQFLGSTWLDMLDRHGDQYGLGWAADAIRDGKGGRKVVDPAMQSQIMALRYDPDVSSAMAAELAKENSAALVPVLGRAPDHAELYLAHFLGSDGAARFLTTLQSDPGTPAAALFPAAARANGPMFYTRGGAARSVAEVMETIRQKMDRAADGDGAFPSSWAGGPAGFGGFPGAAFQPPAPARPPLGPLAQEFNDAAGAHASRTRVSMVDTLRDTFVGPSGHAGALPANVRSAYDKLQAFGL